MRAAVLAIAVMFAGCGRLDFDAESGVGSDGAPADMADASIDPSLLQGCELWMKLDDAVFGTDVIDSCGGDNEGVANSGVTAAVDPVRGRVAEMFGGSSCIIVPDAPSLRGGSALTLSAWVYATAVTPESYGLIAKRTTNLVDNAYASFIWGANFGAGTPNHAYVDIVGVDNRGEEMTEPFLNNWKQLTTVYDGSLPVPQRVAIYIDGQFKTFVAEDAASIPVPMTPPDVAIGCLPLNGLIQGLVGYLDDAVIWSRSLSAAEVSAWYDATKR
ncbi:MAG TPA: LamG-like jellyroll fold domain-containing protein [Kofleriaceae bacterium]